MLTTVGVARRAAAPYDRIDASGLPLEGASRVGTLGSTGPDACGADASRSGSHSGRSVATTNTSASPIATA